MIKNSTFSLFLRGELPLERAQDAGVVSAAEAVSWLGYLEQANQAGHFFLAITGFSVGGRKP